MKRVTIMLLLAFAAPAMAKEHGDARLEIGVRSGYFDLQDSKRGPNNHFLGSIDEFIEKQDYVPSPFINVRFGSNWALSLGYDAFRVLTWSRPSVEEREEGHTDGNIDASGPSISVQYYYPNTTRYTPFAEASLLIYNTYFDPAEAWRDARGDVNSHILDIQDENGYRLGIGCDIQLADNWSLVVTAEQTFMEVDVAYYLYDELRKEVTFPLDHSRYGIGVKCRL